MVLLILGGLEVLSYVVLPLDTSQSIEAFFIVWTLITAMMLGMNLFKYKPIDMNGPNYHAQDESLSKNWYKNATFISNIQYVILTVLNILGLIYIMSIYY